MKLRLFAVVLLGSALSTTMVCGAVAATSTPLPCPDLTKAVQVGACPSDEELRYTFTGFCSDDGKAYKGEIDVCTDFQRYRQLKNVALWESADGLFDAYVSCDLPQATVKQGAVSGVKLGKQGKVTQLVCSYANGINFTHRTRAECKLEAGTASCN